MLYNMRNYAAGSARRYFNCIIHHNSVFHCPYLHGHTDTHTTHSRFCIGQRLQSYVEDDGADYTAIYPQGLFPLKQFKKFKKESEEGGIHKNEKKSFSRYHSLVQYVPLPVYPKPH